MGSDVLGESAEVRIASVDALGGCASSLYIEGLREFAVLGRPLGVGCAALPAYIYREMEW